MKLKSLRTIIDLFVIDFIIVFNIFFGIFVWKPFDLTPNEAIAFLSLLIIILIFYTRKKEKINSELDKGKDKKKWN